MKLPLLIGLALLAVAGRAQAEPAKEPAKDAVPQEARLKIEADVENCRGRQFGTHREAAQCINQAVQRVLISVDYPYMDLLQIVSAYRIACAQKMDARELTQENCTNRMGQLRTRITAEETQRRNAAPAKGEGDVRPASGPAGIDYAALLKGIAGWSAAAGGSAKSGDIVCFQSGPMISCR
jgi:hypothetical protein